MPSTGTSPKQFYFQTCKQDMVYISYSPRVYVLRHYTPRDLITNGSKDVHVIVPVYLLCLSACHSHFLSLYSIYEVDRVSSVGIATGWTVRGSNRGRGRDFPYPSRSALVHTHPPTQWVPGLSREVKRPGLGSDLPHPSSAEVKEILDLFTPPSGP